MSTRFLFFFKLDRLLIEGIVTCDNSKGRQKTVTPQDVGAMTPSNFKEKVSKSLRARKEKTALAGSRRHPVHF